ncbi:bifunctional UDP-N-acetylglucosamine diphosphorylase/glucosamine-1-phosphate N-acetyltransferase GlmU [Desulfovibrio cuneatus]|uniref:bifunctional UDP-N-acetylglucosamine diphosphorylase/glucosamine-1-phosphate N-acetyltransferase GlmU n=1 Tax=Desulfovibrio cuneatus TaxID=159728 RepID=UPI000405BC7A|nr:bifunctional UDP-N-acetylglucosamine diphosphorylase/glucosamine-1-phosphate N-acetyltransferase GlmU [Desulfovibrio cuneatus]
MPASSLSSVGILLLAAGKGTRMHSEKPKVLQPLLETPMLAFVLHAAHAVCGQAVWTVIGHRADMVEAAFPAEAAHFIEQKEQLGTGHALQTAWPALRKAGLSHVVVVNGDTPLVQAETLRAFTQASLENKADVAFISLTLEDPAGFGRVVRHNGRVSAIVEAKDYDVAVHGPEPREINAGVYCLRMDAVEPLLAQLNSANKSGEYYITDLVGHGVAAGLVVEGVNLGSDPALLGVNSPVELVRSEELLRQSIVAGHLARGVFVRQGESVRIAPGVCLAPGTCITGPCELYGETSLAAGTVVESHCVLRNATVAEGVVIRSYTHVEDATIGPRATVGPYGRLRPGAVLEEGVHVGNFVEVKKSLVRKGAKVNHLTYIGDADVGAGVNVGAGTITCNYDGQNKHRTVIGAGAFIGSNTSLVAPVTIGAGALVGAGSVITKEVPEGAMAIARGKQVNVPRKK